MKLPWKKKEAPPPPKPKPRGRPPKPKPEPSTDLAEVIDNLGEYSKDDIEDIHAGGVRELKRRLKNKSLAANISDASLIRLVAETSKLLTKNETQAAPRVQNNYLAIIDSAEGLPPEKRREVLGRIKGELNQAMEAIDGE